MSCEETRKVARNAWELTGGADINGYDEALWMSLVLGVTIPEVLECMNRHREEHLAMGLPEPLPVHRGRFIGSLGHSWRGALDQAKRGSEHLLLPMGKRTQGADAVNLGKYLALEARRPGNNWDGIMKQMDDES